MAARPIARPAASRQVAFGLACLLAPAAMLCAVAAASDVYPFGPRSFLTEDLRYQYVDFFLWLRRVLRGEASLLYSASPSLGLNAWGIYSYYLGSPLNLLVGLCEVDQVTMFVFVTSAVKLGLMQLSAAWFARTRFGLGRPAAFALALCLAWSAWVATNLRNPLWIDALCLLPLAMAGCWRLVREGRVALVVGPVALSVVCCWYMAYMTCLFLCLYVLLEAYLLHVGTPGLGPRRYLRLAAAFAGSLALALALAAWTFVPTVCAMLGSGGGAEAADLKLCRWSDLLAGLFAPTMRTGVTPQLFCGTLPLLLASAFALDRRVDLRERLAVAALAALVTLSSILAPLHLVWCGLRMPNGFYSRVAYLTPLVVLWAAAREWALASREGLGSRRLVAAAAPVAAALAVVGALGHFASAADAALAAVPAVLATAGLRLALPAAPPAADPVPGAVAGTAGPRPGQGASAATSSSRALAAAPTPARARPLAAAALVTLCACELWWCASLAWDGLYTGYPQGRHDGYVADSQRQLAELRAADPGFWRADRTSIRTGAAALNEGLAEGYPSLSSYCSSYNPNAVALLCALGYSQPGEFSVSYSSPILASDALLGVRYVFMRQGGAELGRLGIEPTEDGVAVYENPFTLPLGYGVDWGAADAELALDGGNPFACQNRLASALAGHEVELFSPVEAEVVAEDEPARCRRWRVTAPPATVAYWYVLGEGQGTVDLSIDDGALFHDNYRFRHEVGELGAGTHELLMAARGESSLKDSTECLFYVLDLELLREVTTSLASRPLELREFGADRISGTYEAAGDELVFLGVPWDAGWSLSVGGRPAEPVSLFGGACMGVPVGRGTSVIELRYLPPGLLAGCAVSAVSACGTLAAAIARRRAHACKDARS